MGLNVVDTVIESPIEMRLHNALRMLAYEKDIAVGTWEGSGSMYGEWPAGACVAINQGKGDYAMHIFPQVNFGDYRIDIVLMMYCRWRVGKSYLLVECDGHEYHERTKEQARRDRKRDRDLVQAGHVLFRFTGQEIWRDVDACALQCFETLKAASDSFPLDPEL